MTEQTLLVLSTLAAGPTHGYKIMLSIDELTKGSVKLAAGTLYGILDRLLSQGMIRATGEQTHHGRRRIVYAITARGHAAAVADAERRSQLASWATGLISGTQEVEA